jgi:hypothetical protein
MSRDNGGPIVFLICTFAFIGFVSGCTMGRGDLYNSIFLKKEVCYEAQQESAKWKTCYTLVKKSETTPDQQESR